MILNTFRKEDHEKRNFQSRVLKQRISQKLQFKEMYKTKEVRSHNVEDKRDRCEFWQQKS